MNIKLLALDVDGVMTDGTIQYTEHGEEIKAFNAHDGLGIKYLRKAGVEIAVISGRRSKPLERRLIDLGIRRFRFKCVDKTAALLDMCDELKITLQECAFMGDDWIDMDVMSKVALALAPDTAVKEVKSIAHWVSTKGGGQGAVREACEYLAGEMGVNLADLVNPKEYV